ncbi:MAG: hypothetical protein ISR34_08185 [Pirellulales bacterium]|nr:hypothetical protein [Pirellulales bacterium]
MSSVSASSSESVGPLGSCCAIDRKYVIAEETYPENEYDEMKDWVRSQRQGREGVGLIFVGPVQLRTKEWYGAVVCMGNEEGGGCDCANIEDGWVCTEGVDALSCYLDGGVPGTGVFTEGGNCDEPCENPLLDCQVGCEGCGCCASEAPPAGPDGVACTKWRQIVPYEILEHHYGEALTDPECPNGKMGEIMDYLATRGFDRQGLAIATFRTSDGDNCKVEIWGKPPSCEGESCPTVGQADEDPNWPGITAVPDCSPDACPVLQCVEASDIDVPVMDEWQASQIGGEWKDPAIEGNCPDACSKGYACIYPCYKGMISHCEGFATEQEAIDCVSFTDPANPGASWPARGYLPVGIECSPGSWSGFIVCCYDCAGFGDLCFVCLSGAGNPDFPQGGEAQREPGWEDDVFCSGFGSEELANKQTCNETFPNNYYKEVLAWYTEEDAPQGCDTPEICDGPWDDEQNRKFDIAIEKALKEKEKANVETRALPAGPGTELKKLLKIFGLPDRPGCKCNKRAKTMDSWGPDKCSEPERLTEIIGWLKEEATKQKVPFVEWAARVIVKRAIRNARKAK